jgi:hypothetical protein
MGHGSCITMKHEKTNKNKKKKKVRATVFRPLGGILN